MYLQWIVWTHPVPVTVLVFMVGVIVFLNGLDPAVSLRCRLFVLITAPLKGILRTRLVIVSLISADQTVQPVRVNKH